MALFAVLVVWSCRTPTAPRHGWRLTAEFGVVLLGMLLFSERTWKHHCVTLVVPFAVLCYYLSACRPGRGLRAYLIASLAAVAVLMATTSTGLKEDDLVRQAHRSAVFAKQAQVYGAWVAGYLVLGAALVVLLRRGGGRDAGGAVTVSLVRTADPTGLAARGDRPLVRTADPT
jgi:hypothetical protein